jgi:hypothetical protein
MSTDNNPFAPAGAQYSANVSFGASPDEPKGDPSGQGHHDATLFGQT